MGKVKEKTLRKIEDYFAREVEMCGTPEIQVKFEDIRRETDLSLVTIYKAIEALIESGKLEFLEQPNRRSPKIYRYFAGSNLSKVLPAFSDFSGVNKMLEELIHELNVKEQVIETLRTKLAACEAQESQILYRLEVNEDIEVIVRKKR